MPVQLTYPGVYIEEIPSGNHSIVGAPTAITAFVGRTVKGPVDHAQAVTSFGDFEKFFGSLDFDYPLSYAIKDFFLSGGAEAFIIRRFSTESVLQEGQQDPNYSSVIFGGINLRAASQGTWGGAISVSADTKGITDQIASMYEDYGLVKSDLFNFHIAVNGKVIESFTCVTVKKSKNNPNALDLTLEHESNLVRVSAALPNSFVIPMSPEVLAKPAVTAVTETPGKGNKQGVAEVKAKPAILAVPAKAKSISFSGGKDSAALKSSDDYLGDEGARTGMYALEKVDIFNMLCIPMDQEATDSTCIALNPDAAAFCEKRKAMFIAEPLIQWTDKAMQGNWSEIQPTDLNINGETARYAATYFPRVKMPDPKMQDRERFFSACGLITGAMANNDINRGVWKAPAGQTAGLIGVTGLEVKVNDADNGFLNPLGINCLRDFPVVGPVIWGDRTLRGADLLSDDYKYVSVRRLTNYIEDSLKRGTQWAVFEDNDESLWSQLRLSIGAFMKGLAVQGAFYNYAVKCDAGTTTPDDIALGIVNVEVMFAPVKPAEFVVLKFQQTAASAG